MSQLSTFRSLVGADQSVSDDTLQFYLDNASAIICDIRDTDIVETKYLTHQIKMAIELYNKRGVEGQVGHSELGISRSYEKADISDSLISQITPMAKTPFSVSRVVM